MPLKFPRIAEVMGVQNAAIERVKAWIFGYVRRAEMAGRDDDVIEIVGGFGIGFLVTSRHLELTIIQRAHIPHNVLNRIQSRTPAFSTRPLM